MKSVLPGEFLRRLFSQRSCVLSQDNLPLSSVFGKDFNVSKQ